ncbi:MAG: aldehyde dehydrogenase family protein [Candidatus Omnitrophica bacterium]|nr:aldehyde dehydrogenase family protein [Candidatus Omnitrophota bacterium]
MFAGFKGNYIGGRFVRPKRGMELISEDPGDLLNPVGSVVVSTEAVEEAVPSARRAFAAWADYPIRKKIAAMRRLQRVLKKRLPELTTLISREAGKPVTESRRETDRLVAKVDEIVGAGLELIAPFEVAIAPGVTGECRYRPHGVLAVIGPFNFPAHTPASHIIPALLTGNTVVFKPSEYTPFTGQLLAECIHTAGFPPGVFNLVQGGGAVGLQLIKHRMVSGVLFTGSTATGQAIKEATLDAPQKCLALEMGGKNAGLVLEDAPLELAARESAVAAYSMSGQRCNATSRIIVNKKIAKPFLDLFLAAADRVKIGYSLGEDILMGPLISHEAAAKFTRYMKLAQEEGFETLRAGRTLGSWGERRGYYVTQGVHLCENPSRNSSQHYRKEEIFGPDAAIYLVRNDEEAVALNNEVSYGLVTSVFSGSRQHFERIFPKLDTGLVNWNKGTIFSTGKLPFGGTKASGSFKPTGLFSTYYCTYPVAVTRDQRPLEKRALPV